MSSCVLYEHHECAAEQVHHQTSPSYSASAMSNLPDGSKFSPYWMQLLTCARTSSMESSSSRFNCTKLTNEYSSSKPPMASVKFLYFGCMDPFRSQMMASVSPM